MPERREPYPPLALQVPLSLYDYVFQNPFIFPAAGWDSVLSQPQETEAYSPSNGSLLILISVCFRFPHSSAAPAEFTCVEPQRRE